LGPIVETGWDDPDGWRSAQRRSRAERDSGRARLERSQLRLAVGRSLGEDRDRTAVREDPARRLERLAILRPIEPGVLTPMRRERVQRPAESQIGRAHV